MMACSGGSCNTQKASRAGACPPALNATRSALTGSCDTKRRMSSLVGALSLELRDYRLSHQHEPIFSQSKRWEGGTSEIQMASRSHLHIIGVYKDKPTALKMYHN